MNTFSNIFALAVLAYTADAAKIRAFCKLGANEDQGRIALRQEFDSETGEMQTATVNFWAKELQDETTYNLMILNNDGDLCVDSDTVDFKNDLFQVTSNKWGRARQRGAEIDGLKLTEEQYDGQYAAIVEDGIPIACCELEVKVCDHNGM